MTSLMSKGEPNTLLCFIFLLHLIIESLIKAHCITETIHSLKLKVDIHMINFYSASLVKYHEYIQRSGFSLDDHSPLDLHQSVHLDFELKTF